MPGEATGKPEPRTAEDWLSAVREREDAGDLLAAYDTAYSGLEAFPENRALQHRALLALARAGAHMEALQLFRAWNLDDSGDAELAALAARLVKDAALAAPDPVRMRTLAAEAATRYGTLHEWTGDPYPGINAATLWRLAGDITRARHLAGQVVTDTRTVADEESNEARYYRLASRAEALLLLDDPDGARDVLTEAAAILPDNLSARATTRRQLRRLLILQQQPADVLEPLTQPTVAHFTGHRINPAAAAGRFSADQETRISAEIAEAVRRHDIRFGFGSLAAGADILTAEAILAAGGEIHIVLPFREEEFIDVSVRPSGGDWEARYHACRVQASSLRFATEDHYLGDDMLFDYCARYAMGLALLNGRFIDAPLLQLAVWDGQPGDGVAGTGNDAGHWQTLDLPQVRINPGGSARETSSTGGERVNRALLFGDFAGFSNLGDAEVRRFVEHVMSRVATVLETYGSSVESVETWGDAIYAVFADIRQAAHCALDLQATVETFDTRTCGLPADIGLRVGAHYGPVYRIRHPVDHRMTSVGAQVSRAARIEPVTLPGTVRVSEPFAAILELQQDPVLQTDYLGQVAAAKQYGAFAMYRLHRVPGTGPAEAVTPD